MAYCPKCVINELVSKKREVMCGWGNLDKKVVQYLECPVCKWSNFESQVNA